MGRASAHVAALAALLVLLCCSAGRAAEPATVSGRLVGGELPAAEQGLASVRAVSLRDWSVAGAARVGRSGAYRLELPAGDYALVASVMRRGAPATLTTATPVRLRAQARASAALPLRRVAGTGTGAGRGIAGRPGDAARSLPRRLARTTGVGVGVGFGAAAAAGDAGRGTAVAIARFTGASGAFAALGDGMPDLLAGSLVRLAARKAGALGACRLTLVEWGRRRDVLGQVRRSGRPGFGAATRVPPRTRIAPQLLVRGAIAAGAGAGEAARATISVRIADVARGRLRGATSVTTDWRGLAAAADRLAAQIDARLCPAQPGLAEQQPATPPPAPAPTPDPATPAPGPTPTTPAPAPPASGLTTLRGSFSATARLLRSAYSWDGTVAYRRAEAGSPGAAGTYAVTGGSVTVRASGQSAEYDDCTMSGQATFGLAPATLGQVVVRSADAAAPAAPPYAYEIVQPFAAARTMSVTLSACPAQAAQREGQVVAHTLPMEQALSSVDPASSADGRAFAGTGTYAENAFVNFAYRWSLTGS